MMIEQRPSPSPVRQRSALKCGRDILLFYKDFERDSWFKNDRYIKRVVRPIYNIVRKGAKVSGFFMWYQLLTTALRKSGYRVHLNDYNLARRNPDFPVGLVGYPHLLDDWALPNPAILGPSLFDHPKLAPNLFEDPRYRRYIVTCDWMYRMFQPYYGDRCVQWYAGMDVDRWLDTKTLTKDNDILLYDKIRWNREVYEPTLVDTIINLIKDRGLSFQHLRYGQYDHNSYQEILRRSRSMIFLCEHETQGLAYQEALASNVPILAWDNGFWLDPRRPDFEPAPVPATSVPFFSPECGERFASHTDLPAAFDLFWSRLPSYTPREYIKQEVTFEGSAEIYAKHYFALC